MRKVLLTGVLGLSLLMGACTSKQVSQNEVRRDVKIYAGNFNKSKVEIEDGQVTTEYFKINTEFQNKLIRVAITNTSDEVMIVEWEKSAYIGLDGKEQKLVNMRGMKEQYYAKERADSYRSGQTIITELVPEKNLEILEGDSLGAGKVYIKHNLLENEEVLNEHATIKLSVVIGGVKKGVRKEVEIYFGEGDMPQSLGDTLYARNDSMVAAPVIAPVETAETTTEAAPVAVQKTEAPLEVTAPDAMKIKDENALLEQEIRSKNQLIQELNERARLKKELEEKQKEIDALMLQLN
ncbi:hypothetical protein PM10SUCC1_15800 [Propionigenium maris DSM 9537]|uniref:Lipoprotein n=1 Tax=Propionigenium maris DSM 9537 TaxID=1123000 RepID=A0A9W6GLL4_9FUSO|nr:hypothetical protein [Propionigenium maris]GLI56066.1 hypothetical protein PM10SUCC1_15800 [Propionigenium maris DSM 9537]